MPPKDGTNQDDDGGFRNEPTPFGSRNVMHSLAWDPQIVEMLFPAMELPQTSDEVASCVART